MSLATRCTSCGTVFRVVQDQLKVSEGWVRCGRCEQVFNALEGLFDLERETPPGAAAVHFEDVHAADDRRTYEPASDDSAFGSTQPTDPVDAQPPAEDSDLVDRIDAHLFGTRRAESNTRPSELVSKRDRHEFSDARFDTKLFVDEEEELQPGIGIGTETQLPTGESVPARLERVAPEFVRQAQRRAYWQKPRVRAMLATLLVVLSLAFVLQAAHHFRDTTAARWPGLKPALLAWCDFAGCDVATPKRIDDIVVDSTALGRFTAADGNDALRLSVTLRNRGSLPVALPSIDLSLTDSAGQLLSRRVLAPSDFRAKLASLPPGGDVTLQAPLAADSLRITGFTVEVFYP